jgi:DNA-binding winged helix-turn-helix (wHTH) protein/TolB-like protein/Tfp pilus assembly protein PilF
MPASSPADRVVRFGIFELDLSSGELRKSGTRVKLHDQPFQVLAILLSRPREVVTREEIRKKLWPDDTFVDYDHGLNNAVNRLREALGDTAETPRYIETLPRRGYRFIGAVNAAVAPGENEIVAPVETVVEGSNPVAPESKKPATATRKRNFLVAISMAVLMVAAIVAFLYLRQPLPVQTTRVRAVAILPLQNASGAKDYDFLRIGLADDIATTLSYYPSLSIRPFATSNRYAGADSDLQKAAQEMRVGDIITGHFAVIGNNLEVTLEAVDPAGNRVIWRDTFRGTTQDLIQIQQQLAASVQHGLIAALGVSGDSRSSSNASHNAEAYELYLRALSQNDVAISQSSSFASSNKEAIRLLQRAVALDPGYASAWAVLGHFYYYDIGFGGGGESAKVRAKAALRRAVALDPDHVDAASDLINIESEEGDLNGAYDDTQRLLAQRPDSGSVHLVHAYVLWYAGLLDEAASECEKSRSLDPGTTDLASCGSVFMALGKYDRAREYLQLVSGTEYERSNIVEVLLREGKREEALHVLQTLPRPGALYGRPLLEPCLSQHATPNDDPDIQKLRSGLMADDDGFQKYLLAGWDSYCGHPDLAFQELRRAIQQNYCAYPQMETDPLLAPIRAAAEFANIRSIGVACRQRFLEYRRQSKSK